MRDEMDVSEDHDEEAHELKPPKSLLDALVRNRDDYQRTRIRITNRIGACKRGGWDPGLLTALESGLPMIEAAEKDADKTIRKLVRKHPVWQAWLSEVRGIAESLAAPLLEYLDPHAEHLSCWYQYLGLGCDERGDATRKLSGQKAAYNHYLKTHAVFKIGSAFIKSGGFYRDIYDQEKEQLAARPPVQRHIDRAKLWVLAEPLGKHAVGTLLDSTHFPKVKKTLEAMGRQDVFVTRRPLHLHQMARRAAVKLFLSHLYAKWREVLELPVDPPYAQTILGHTGYIPPERAVEKRDAELVTK